MASDTLIQPIPQADATLGLQVLQAFQREKSPLAALRLMRDNLGDIFQISIPGFDPIFLSGPKYSRFVLVDGRDYFLRRTESDPVTRLLRHGLLVEDGDLHDRLRSPMNEILSGKRVLDHIEIFWRSTDAVTQHWKNGDTVDMLVEMRKIALLIFMQALFAVDFSPDLDRLWQAILRLLKYISPGLWIIAPNLPRPGYKKDIHAVDAYLYELIRDRRAHPIQGDDLLTRLVNIPSFDDQLIRDQLLTMLIAGHDTSTALLAWTLFLLGAHPKAMERVSKETRSTIKATIPTSQSLKKLSFLEMVIKESLRLYPPIHVGNRKAAVDIPIDGFTIPAGKRVMYSIYLTHRDPNYWTDPDMFQPERFDRINGNKPTAFSYLPFGGGPRTCIGAAFAQVEAKAVLSRLLSRYELILIDPEVKPYMGATLEPRPGVMMRIQHRETI
jgi:cytochrome P450